MASKLEHVFAMRGYMNKENSLDLKTIKSGLQRIIVPITHGFVEGSGLKAEILDPGTNVSHLDVRTQARTSDGESIYVHYSGVLKVDEATGKVLSWSDDAKTTSYGDHEWFSSPIIETSSEEFKWVGTALFVGQGHWIVEDGEQAVEYQIFKVTN